MIILIYVKIGINNSISHARWVFLHISNLFFLSFLKLIVESQKDKFLEETNRAWNEIGHLLDRARLSRLRMRPIAGGKCTPPSREREGRRAFTMVTGDLLAPVRTFPQHPCDLSPLPFLSSSPIVPDSKLRSFCRWLSAPSLPVFLSRLRARNGRCYSCTPSGIDAAA